MFPDHIVTSFVFARAAPLTLQNDRAVLETNGSLLLSRFQRSSATCAPSKKREHVTASHSTPRPTMSRLKNPTMTTRTQHAMTRQSTPRPSLRIGKTESATQPDTSRYVALLERDNEFLREQVSKKDEQISDLSTRFSETQTLLGAMQRMFAPLLGQADPFNRPPEKREVQDAQAS